MIQLYLSFFIKSFKYIRKRSGLKIDPCGTPPLISPASEKISSVTKNFLFERSDWNLLMTDSLKSIYSIFIEVQCGLMYERLSVGQLESSSSHCENLCLFLLKIKSASCIRPESVEAFAWKHKVVFIQKIFVWMCMIFSVILDTTGNSEMGL